MAETRRPASTSPEAEEEVSGSQEDEQQARSRTHERSGAETQNYSSSVVLSGEDEVLPEEEDPSQGGNVNVSGTNQNKCRFCLSGEEDGELFTPCGCLGSSKYVHLHCLRAWQRTVQLQMRDDGPAAGRAEGRGGGNAAAGERENENDANINVGPGTTPGEEPRPREQEVEEQNKEQRHERCSLCLQKFQPGFEPLSRSEFLQDLCKKTEQDFDIGTLFVHERERGRNLRLQSLPFMLRVIVEMKHQHFRNACYLLVDEEQNEAESSTPVGTKTTTIGNNVDKTSERAKRKVIGFNLVRPISLTPDEWNLKYSSLRDFISEKPSIKVYVLAGGPCHPRAAKGLAVLDRELLQAEFNKFGLHGAGGGRGENSTSSFRQQIVLKQLLDYFVVDNIGPVPPAPAEQGVGVEKKDAAPASSSTSSSASTRGEAGGEQSCSSETRTVKISSSPSLCTSTSKEEPTSSSSLWSSTHGPRGWIPCKAIAAITEAAGRERGFPSPEEIHEKMNQQDELIVQPPQELIPARNNYSEDETRNEAAGKEVKTRILSEREVFHLRVVEVDFTKNRLLVYATDFHHFMNLHGLRNSVRDYLALVLGQAEWDSTQLLGEYCKGNWGLLQQHPIELRRNSTNDGNGEAEGRERVVAAAVKSTTEKTFRRNDCNFFRNNLNTILPANVFDALEPKSRFTEANEMQAQHARDRQLGQTMGENAEAVPYEDPGIMRMARQLEQQVRNRAPD
ncbi:unnamed protein product [Amoebophrya sp. A120]|nr:unnamed protein product [Amoebophrya sp. A120]|eukprot:GSA120T00020513001.1